MLLNYLDLVQFVETSITLFTPNTGYFGGFIVRNGQEISPGTDLYIYEQLGKARNVMAGLNGTVSKRRRLKKGDFYSAGTPVLDVLVAESFIGMESMYQFITAPQTGSYYFTEQGKPLLEIGGVLRNGAVMLVMEQMKQFSRFIYEGPDVVVAKLYFKNEQMIRKGEKLYGLITLDQANHLLEERL